jgi:glucan phosphorylase
MVKLHATLLMRTGDVALWHDKEGWTRRAINSVANMSRFSADRAIDEYADHIWRTRAAG